MKFWNKDKGIRQRCWTKVTLPVKPSLKPVPGGWIQTQSVSSTEVKRWCQQQDSTGKFYHYYGANSWWFELKEDAIIFRLRFS